MTAYTERLGLQEEAVVFLHEGTLQVPPTQDL